MNLSNFKRIVRDCRAEQNDYIRTRDWVLRLYDRLLNRWLWAPLPFRKKICEIYRKGVPQPFALRLGSSDWQVLNEIYLRGEYEELLKCDLGKPRWIVDLGSNIGLTLRLWRRHYPEARILAVEPDPDNVRILRMNAPESGTEKIIVAEACVLGHVRPVQLQQGAGEWGYSVQDVAVDSPGKIAAFTMPELLQRHCSDAMIDLLKCDIEGAEAELFRNCGSWLQRVRFALVELHGSYRLKDFERDTRESGIPIDILWSEEADDFSLVIFRTRCVDSGKK
jgi:FkbM family methyltransferase